jgi:hypothetical protein
MSATSGTVDTPNSAATLDNPCAATDGSWRPSAVKYGAT